MIRFNKAALGVQIRKGLMDDWKEVDKHWVIFDNLYISAWPETIRC